jgi:hypothetical protein
MTRRPPDDPATDEIALTIFVTRKTIDGLRKQEALAIWRGLSPAGRGEWRLIARAAIAQMYGTAG